MVFSYQQIDAQESSPEVKHKKNIEMLEKVKETIVQEEKELLRKAVETINNKVSDGKITKEEGEELKVQAAKKHALNIENRIAIVDNKIALLKRNEHGISPSSTEPDDFVVSIGSRSYSLKGNRSKFRYDRRTYSDLVMAFGLNNAIIDGQSLNNSPYTIGKSRFFEIGVAWTTRVFDNTNAVRFKYGFSFQFNGLSPEDNQYFVQNGDVTTLETFSQDLNKVKLRMDNLVIPIHFEFGPSKKKEYDDYFRYSTHKKFKFGIGGYAGLNLGTRQKLKYKENGDRRKDKIKGSYNTNDFVYGLSGYIGRGDTSLYIKYDLNPIFNNQTVDQNNISLGLRFDW
jgi:hypothetical protein